MDKNGSIQSQYEEAVAQLVEKLQRDPYIVAAILLGSLSYDVVWEKSDIDMLLVTEETRSRSGG
jgi:predicted nucleotidyltransferase